MAETGNMLFDVSTEVGNEIFKAKKQAQKATPVEFRYTKGDAHAWRKAVRGNETFRKSELQKLGVEDFLKRWGGRGRNGNT